MVSICTPSVLADSTAFATVFGMSCNLRSRKTFAPIALYEQIEIERQPRWIDFQCDDRSVPQGDENLVVRAAKAFFERTHEKGGISIELKKKIPHSAGLGGGSSDAAATLIALNQLF